MLPLPDILRALRIEWRKIARLARGCRPDDRRPQPFALQQSVRQPGLGGIRHGFGRVFGTALWKTITITLLKAQPVKMGLGLGFVFLFVVDSK